MALKDKELLNLLENKTELNKQILQQNQLLDRLRHYEAQGNVMDLIQKELKDANKCIENLTAQNTELNQIVYDLQNKITIAESAVIHNDSNKTVEKTQEVDGQQDDINESIRRKIEDLEKTNSELEKKMKEMSSAEGTEQYEIKYAQYLDKEKAMDKLEERFKKTMDEVAELNDEKQRLEHLVMQLQSETETIGEYVTLYQCQRAMLKQKTIEKDEQLERLTKDREEMKVKLEELNSLIRKLVLEKGDIPEEVLNNKLLVNKYNNFCEIHGNNQDIPDGKTEVINGSNNENNNLGTAGQIIALLSDIKTSSLVQPNPDIQNFHPCPWCSGKLITV